MHPTPRLHLGFVVAFAVTAAPALAADGWFDCPYRAYRADLPVRSVAIADLNGDGLPDLVSGSGPTGPTYTVMLGNTRGSFDHGPAASTSGISVQAVVIDDFNQDGHPDLAFATDQNSCLVTKGVGDGSFGPAFNYPTGSFASSIAVGRFNADAYPDLVVCNTYSGTLSVLVANAVGNFAAATNYPTGGLPYGVTAADLNLDGKSDVACAISDSARIQIRRGVGFGLLAGATNVATTTSPRAVAIGRINGDAYPDLVVAGTEMTVLLADGVGGYTRTDVSLGMATQRVRLADVDQDGDLDVVLLDSTGYRLVIVRSHGDGTFDPPIVRRGAAMDLAVGNTDGDAIPDIVSVVQNQFVSVFRGNGDGTFGTLRTFATPTGPYAAAAADFNKDGRMDIAVSCTVADSITVRQGNGDGTFGARLDLFSGDAPKDIATGDFNGDAKPDIAVLNASTPYRVSVFLGSGTGTFSRIAYPAGALADRMTVADLNEDGRTDVITSSGNNGSVYVLLASATGALAAPVQYIDPNWPMQAVPCDLNEDGHLDVASANFNETFGLSTWFGAGNGTLGTRTDIGIGASSIGIAAGDADEDGNLDLALLRSSDLQMRYGVGNGTFSGGDYWNTGVTPNQSFVGDMNGDGEPDMLTGGSGVVAATVGLVLGPAGATTSYYGVGGESVRPLVSDWNADGRKDVALPLPDDRLVSVLIQRRGAGAADVPMEAPATIRLGPALPNPASETVAFRLQLTREAKVSFHIVDVSGRVVHHETEPAMEAGVHELRWDGVEDSGARVRPGVYFAVIDSGRDRARRSFVWVR